MKYYDFDIRISSRVADHYPVNAESESMGQAESVLPVASVDALRSKVTEFGRAEFSETALQELGVSLFNTLFVDSIGNLYQRSLGHVSLDEDAGVRIRLRIQPPEIATLPWEQLYDSSSKCFLATSKETLLLRYIELSKPIRSLQTALPIRILIVIPEGSGLDVEVEKSKLVETLASLNSAIETEVLQGKVTSASISRALVLKQFHILHFIGHGDFRNNAGCLVLNSESDGQDDFVGANQFAYHFQDDPCMKLIVLNSCSGAMSSAGALTGVAQELVSMGVPAVVAMRQEVTDEAAKLFAESFYLKLCLGYEPGRVDIAVAHARKELKRALFQNDEFSNPVLFMRSPKGVIFDLGEGTPVTTLPQLHTNNAINNTLLYNIAQLQKEGGPEAEAVIAEEKKAQSKVRARATQFYTQIAKAAAPRVLLMVLLLALGVFVASYTQILNAFKIDDYVAGVLRSWSPATQKPLHRDVRVVLAQEEANGELGKPDIGWRKFHTAIINAFAAAEQRPKAVAIDLLFNRPSGDDAEMARAVVNAKSKGVHVVASQKINVEGDIEAKSELNPTLNPVFTDSWGDVAVGRELELPLLGKQQVAYEYEVASLPKDWTSRAEVQVVPSLALKAIMQAYSVPDSPLRAVFDEGASQVILKAGNNTNPVFAPIPVIKRDLSLDMLLDHLPRSSLKTNTLEYKDVYKWATSNRVDERQYLERQTKDAILLVGYETHDDRHAIIRGEPRSGVEIHANAVSNILTNNYIHEMPGWAQFLVIAGMAALGVLIQTHLRKYVPGEKELELPWIGKTKLPLLLTLVVFIYVLIAYLIYSRSRVTFDMSYHIAALLFGYWLVTIFRRQLRLAAGVKEK